MRFHSRPPRPATVERFAPPDEIRSNTAARRAWCEAKRAELVAAGREAKIVGTGSYQEVTAKIVRDVPTRAMLIGVCQICARRIGTTSGVIAHHGYQRPEGLGYQTASCAGARHLPLSDSDAQLLVLIADLGERQIPNAEQRVADLSREITSITITREKRLPYHQLRQLPKPERSERVTLTPADGRDFEVALASARSEAAYALRSLQLWLTDLTEREAAYVRGEFKDSTYEEQVPV